MKSYNYNGSTEYEKVVRLLDIGYNCKMMAREKFAELREAFLIPL